MKAEELKVLICDDSILIRKKLKGALEMIGVVEILEASNGQEAIDMYKQNKADLVFMDIVMPNKNGLEALTEIKQYDPASKIVMASTAGTKTHIKEAIKAGAYEFIQKPIEQDRLSEIIENIVKGGE